LLALAFAVTIGTVTSPIGNPQNLLIAVNGNVANPFITFFRYLLIPTLINLFLAYLVLRLFYWKRFRNKAFTDNPEPIKDLHMAQLCRISMVLLGVLILAKIVTVFAGLQVDFRLTYIALAAALPFIIFSSKRLTIIRKIDWTTLVFFAAMFILMASVWNSGVFQNLINSTSMNLTSVPVVMGVSVVLSQFISNVPLVALYLPLLMKMGVSATGLMALAVGSTIAGNLTILGAASNVIIIQNAEQKSGETLTFWEFFRIGLPLTAINIFVYWLYFKLVG
jgi:Na+/H+ antiporter NhaD/arsenite permease-like protein